MRRAVILSLGLLLAMTALAILPTPAQAAEYTIFDEDFDGAWPGPWTDEDENPDAGLDYWGVTSRRDDGGTSSAWVAQVGTSSQNGMPNFVNGFQDHSMNSYLRLPMEDLAGYSQVSLRFSHWVEMEMGDSLAIRAQSAGSWFTLWSVQGPLSRGWTTSIVDVPLSTEFLEFRYVSASSHMMDLEGAYVDNVRVTGDDVTPPLLSVTAPTPGTWYSSRSLLVTWSAEDTGSGLHYVELRLDFGSWLNVGPAPSYSLTGLGEGLHTLTIRAVDRIANVATQSVTFGVDVTPPSATILKPAEGSIVTSSIVPVDWRAQDGVSQVSQVEARIDGGAWADVGVVGPYEISDLRDGTHTVTLRVTDTAGNARETDVSFRVDTNPFSPDGPNKGLLLYGLVAAGLLALLFALGWLGRLPFWPTALRRKSGKGEPSSSRENPSPRESGASEGEARKATGKKS